MRNDRFTLAAITVVAVLAAFLAAQLLPGDLVSPVLTWSITYTAAVLGIAHKVSLPPARTLWAATLLIGAVLRLVLTGLRVAIDGALLMLALLNSSGLQLLDSKAASA
jgi:hypothetical protein